MDHHRWLSPHVLMVLLAAAVVGVVAGAGVAGLERLAIGAMWEHLADSPLWMRTILPAAGVVAAALVLRFGGWATVGGRISNVTLEEYVAAHHDRVALDPRPLPWRLVGSILTIGSGGPGGLEAPAVYLGAQIGSFADRRGGRQQLHQNALIAAGAAAGVAALLRAPLTGTVFALEVPYRDHLDHHSLLAAFVGSASGFATAVWISGNKQPFGIPSVGSFHTWGLLVALSLGIVCGLFARGVVLGVGLMKLVQKKAHLAVTLAGAAAVLVAVSAVGHAVFHQDLALTPGYSSVKWALEPHRTAGLLLVLLALRVAGLLAIFGGGGVTGAFVPLIVGGALVGRLAAVVVDNHHVALFVILGMAATLGAGYRVPLTSVVLVAELTGHPAYVAPALLASVVAQVMMGRASVSPLQRAVTSAT